MKKFVIVAIFLSGLFFSAVVNACPACEKQQPRILRGISHGSGPQSNWDLWIVSIAVVIVLATLYFSVKWLVRPGEKSPQHIKRFILTND